MDAFTSSTFTPTANYGFHSYQILTLMYLSLRLRLRLVVQTCWNWTDCVVWQVFCWSFMLVLWMFQEELAARVAEQQAAVAAAGLLDKKESDDGGAVIGPSMPEPEPPHIEVTDRFLLC